AVGFNIWLAHRLRPPLSAMSMDQQSLDRYRMGIAPYKTWLLLAVTALVGLLGPGARRACRLIALAFVAAFAVLLVWYGLDAPLNSFARGRTSGSMLDIPAWWPQAAVPFACALLALQSIVEFVRTAMGAPLPPENVTEE
ncbi:TRAP transporter small permease, partial [Lutimaribacter sp. EGI FJ00014]|nr:TRAP transporter small permease [Lutimaribacter sp. EGI FJ00014]